MTIGIAANIVLILIAIAAFFLFVWCPLVTVPRFRKQNVTGAQIMAANRAEYKRIEAEAMAAWEDACQCPEPRAIREYRGVPLSEFERFMGQTYHQYEKSKGDYAGYYDKYAPNPPLPIPGGAPMMPTTHEYVHYAPYPSGEYARYEDVGRNRHRIVTRGTNA